jgi:hypothetical protein
MVWPREPYCPLEIITAIWRIFLTSFKFGKWHSGQWGAGRRIIKVIWQKDNQLLSSGFTVALNNTETDELIAELNAVLMETEDNAP